MIDEEVINSYTNKEYGNKNDRKLRETLATAQRTRLLACASNGFLHRAPSLIRRANEENDLWWCGYL